MLPPPGGRLCPSGLVLVLRGLPPFPSPPLPCAQVMHGASRLGSLLNIMPTTFTLPKEAGQVSGLGRGSGEIQGGFKAGQWALQTGGPVLFKWLRSSLGLPPGHGGDVMPFTGLHMESSPASHSQRASIFGECGKHFTPSALHSNLSRSSALLIDTPSWPHLVIGALLAHTA